MIEELFKGHGIHEDSKMTNVIPLLQGPAGEYYRSVTKRKGHIMSWPQLREVLGRRYDNTESQQAVLEYKMKCSQYRGEDRMDEYVTRYRELEVRTPDVGYKEKYFWFVRTLTLELKTHLREHVQKKMGQDMEAVYDAATNWALDKLIDEQVYKTPYLK